MSRKGRISKGEVRRAVREVLALQEGEPLGEEPMLRKVNTLIGGGADLTDLRDAIEWNHGEAFIRREDVEEYELRGWVITKAGINHDRIR